MAGPLPTPTPSPSPSFLDLQRMAHGTQPVPSASNSNTPIPVPTQTPPPRPPTQDVLYVNSDGSSHRGQWPPEHLSDSKRKGKQPAGRPNVDASRRRRGLDSSDASDSHLSPQLVPRQQNASYPSCDDVGNNILSCYPTSGVTINQGDWTKFVWNTNIPDFIGLPGKVDVYLYHADSGQQVQSWLGLWNVQGQISVVANDSFWDYRMSKWQAGQRIPYTYYFVIVKAGTQLTGGEKRQATWTAIQTAFADSVYASSSAAASVSSASLASYLSAVGPASSSLIAASMSRASATATSGTSGAGLQGAGDGGNNGGFPAWAIALLVILGFLAFLSMAGLGYVLIRNWRRRHRRGSSFSIDSASPMMAQAGGANSEAGPSPVTYRSPDHFAKSGPLAAAGAMMGAGAAAGAGGTRNNSVQYDGASTRSVSDAGLFSGQDAQIMADAFRKALRKPDFADRPLEEGESPSTGLKNTPSSGALPIPSPAKPHLPSQPQPPTAADPDVISRELAEEGRDLRSVSSIRGVTVQSMDDGSAEGTTTTGTNRKPS